ncbi:MAG: phosphoglucosamine mutase [Acutalibacteraceae bacterium]
MGRLFGTDGARGVANTELTCELAVNIGRAAAMVLANSASGMPTVVIGKDTRKSSDMLECALTAGLCSIGANVLSVGVVPTPAVAYLVKKYNANAGIMISASHNPHEYNGIKIFNLDGYKLPDMLEEEIESIVIDKDIPYPTPVGEDLGTVKFIKNAVDDYIQYVASTIGDNSLSGLKVAFDCANGSASRTAEKLFTSLGVECFMLSDKPDGININNNCGSTHMDNLKNFVIDNKLDIGIAFDGDADRCLAVDGSGNIMDGDYIMAICALDFMKKDKLQKNTVVGTVMTNMGFNKFCDENGIDFVATKVGDRYVLEEMLLCGYNFGGEQSGHVIFGDYATTGDGQLTAVQLLNIIKNSNQTIAELSTIMKRYPQVLINVRISPDGKLRFYTDKEVQHKIKEVEKKLGQKGRILVRVSGTEPLLRVMLEGEDMEMIERLAEETANVVRVNLA